MSLTIKRQANYVKEPLKDGDYRIRRIPWDLLDIEEHNGFFCSPMPVNPDGFDARVATTAYTSDTVDMISDEDRSRDIIDEVTKIAFFNSEQEFYSLFGNNFGFYKSSADEFGG